MDKNMNSNFDDNIIILSNSDNPDVLNENQSDYQLDNLSDYDFNEAIKLPFTEYLSDNISDENVFSNNFDQNSIDCNDEENNITAEPKFKNLVLSGGAIRGISLIGAVKKLVDEHLIDLKKLKAIVGTSAGAMLALLITLGYTINEIWDIVYNLEMKKFVNPDISLFLKYCGVETGEIIHNWFEDIITKKTNVKHINFKQLYEITKIHLTIVGSCLTTKEVVYFDHINSPTLKVSSALRISISIPGFFKPFTLRSDVFTPSSASENQISPRLEKYEYIDGGVLNNYAMNLLEDRLDETVGVLISNDYDTNYTCPEEYFTAILNLFMYHYYKNTIYKYKNNTIYVKKGKDSISAFNFDVNNNTKIKLFDSGVHASEEFINDFYNKRS